MKLGQFVFVGILLHLAVTTAVHKDHQDELPIVCDNQVDPHFWEKSGKFEGDMVLTPEQQERLYKDDESRNGLINTTYRWPNNTIPFVISSDFDPGQNEYITEILMDDFSRSCVRVVPRTNEADYVFITGKPTGCWSHVGRLGGRQELNLQRHDCVYHPIIIHEFLHAAGCYHAHNIYNRDDYLIIIWYNIEPGQEHNFEKYGKNATTSFGENYDYRSVMHYGEKAFSKNGQLTMLSKLYVVFGKYTKLSTLDIRKLNKMYDC